MQVIRNARFRAFVNTCISEDSCILFKPFDSSPEDELFHHCFSSWASCHNVSLRLRNFDEDCAFINVHPGEDGSSGSSGGMHDFSEKLAARMVRPCCVS